MADKPETPETDPHADLHKMQRPEVKAREGDDELSILEEARRRAAHGWTQWSDNIELSKAELGFLMGEQWPDQAKREREAQQRPVLTLNTLPTHVDQVVNDIRQNRPGIHVGAADDSDNRFLTNAEEPEEISQAEVFEGLIREIEYESDADTSYDTAAQHAVEAGWGWLRVLTEWRDNDSFDQDIRIKPIRYRHSVIMDPDATEFDFSDANWCFIPDSMIREEFQKLYPEAMLGSFGTDAQWWGDDRHITVTEYFYREPYRRELYLLSNGNIMFKDEFEEIAQELTEADVTVKRRRTVTQFKVYWCRCTAHEILEGPILWPGQSIPVVPVFGKHFDTDKGPIFRGVTRYAADAKRAHNYWMTAATERVALSPKAPWTLTPEQIEGHEAMWQNLHTSNYAYVLYNHVEDAGRPVPPPQRVQPASMPAAELQVALNMKDEVKGTVGMFDAALGARSNETSGKAIMARQRESDVAHFTFADNLSRAIRRIGQILVEVIPAIYDSNRTIRVRSYDEKVRRVEINKPIVAEDGEPVVVNDMTKGRFVVRVKSGPSYTTQREEAAEALQQVVQADPNLMQIIGDVLFNAMDWPGADEIAKRLRMRLPPHMLTKEERDKMPEPQPTPEQQAEMADAKAQMAKAEADMAKAEADKMKAQAEGLVAQKEMAVAQAAEGGDLEDTIKNAVAEGVAAAFALMRGEGEPAPQGENRGDGQA